MEILAPRCSNLGLPTHKLLQSQPATGARASSRRGTAPEVSAGTRERERRGSRSSELRWSHEDLETEPRPETEAQRDTGTRGQRDPREREKAEGRDSRKHGRSDDKADWLWFCLPKPPVITGGTWMGMDAVGGSCGTQRVLGGLETPPNSQGGGKRSPRPRTRGVSPCRAGAASRNEPHSASAGPQDTQSSRTPWSNREGEQSREVASRGANWPPSPLSC